MTNINWEIVSQRRGNCSQMFLLEFRIQLLTTTLEDVKEEANVNWDLITSESTWNVTRKVQSRSRVDKFHDKSDTQSTRDTAYHCFAYL